MTIFRSWPFDIFDSLANDKRIHVCLELLQSFFTALLCCLYWGCLVFLAYFCWTKHQSARFSKVTVCWLFWQPTSLIHKLRGIHSIPQPASALAHSSLDWQKQIKREMPKNLINLVPRSRDSVCKARESHLLDNAMTLEPSYGLIRRVTNYF